MNYQSLGLTSINFLSYVDNSTPITLTISFTQTNLFHSLKFKTVSIQYVVK
jgi:hypothetical protein